MKHNKLLVFLLIAILFVLAGCNTRELEFERTYPDTTELNELRAEKQKERQSNPEYAKYAHLINSNQKPLELRLLSSQPDDSIYVLDIQATNFCWKDSVLECLHLEDNEVLSNSDLNLPIYTIQKRRLMTLSTSGPEETLSPTRVEISVYDKDHYWKPITYGMSNQYTYDFEAPAEVGTYIYIFRALFEDVIGGVALYPVMVIVTDD